MACITSIASKEELNRTIQAMARAKLENSTFVRIPILGIAFDVNWLIIASGLGFCAIYFLLYYSLSRERKNIKLLFQIAIVENISIVRLYQFMSMQQVFTIPQSIDEYIDVKSSNDNLKEKRSNKIKRIIPKIFWCSPLIFWAFIFGYDLVSRKIGMVINPFLTELQFAVSTFLGLFICLLAFLCIRESVRIDAEWHLRSLDIKKSEEDQNAPS